MCVRYLRKRAQKMKVYQMLSALLERKKTAKTGTNISESVTALAAFVKGKIEGERHGGTIRMSVMDSSTEQFVFTVDLLDSGVRKVVVKPSFQHILTMNCSGSAQYVNDIKGVVFRTLMEDM